MDITEFVNLLGARFRSTNRLDGCFGGESEKLRLGPWWFSQGEVVMEYVFQNSL
jgi:hypothetical protein